MPSKMIINEIGNAISIASCWVACAGIVSTTAQGWPEHWLIIDQLSGPERGGFVEEGRRIAALTLIRRPHLRRLRMIDDHSHPQSTCLHHLLQPGC